MGLYRDDGLGVVRASPQEIDKLTKKVAALLKAMNLTLTFKVNITTTDFLDVKLDLEADEYKPYMKPNDTPYISTRGPTIHPIYSKISQLGLRIESQQIQAARPFSTKPPPPTKRP